MHKSHDELHSKLAAAAQQVTVNGVYAHYKNPDQHYTVLQLAITEWDDEICVIYQVQYDPALVFVRPLESWLATVAWNGATVARFTKISDK